MQPKPAHTTKHQKILSYHSIGWNIELQQQDKNEISTTGTTLWLSGQILSTYLAQLPQIQKRPRVIELGAGIGLISLTLAAKGCSVLATDVKSVITTVLQPNVEANTPRMPAQPGGGMVQVRELDWTVDSNGWQWDDAHTVASHSPRTKIESTKDDSTLKSPFDMIVTSDTVYAPELAPALFRTIRSLCETSRVGSKTPPVYVCLERRDPALIDNALNMAKNEWGFFVERVPPRKVVKAMLQGGLNWEKEDWDGVEIYKMALKAQTNVEDRL